MFKGAVLRYLISDALSTLGNSIAGVVLPLVLLARTGDVLAAGSLALICAIPQFVCGILGGALLDRINRKAVCIASDLISAASVALLPIIDSTVGLSYAWFVILGLLGAVGDVPGATARDALLPEVSARENADLQRFVGASQSLNALITVAGPAAAALLIGLIDNVDALWVTAACSTCAALVTATLPRGTGSIAAPAAQTQAPKAHRSGNAVTRLLSSARDILAGGLTALFADSPLLRTTTLLSFCVTMVMAGWQGIVLPAYFTELAQPQLTGVFVSAMGGGMLAGSLAYTALSAHLSRRAWFRASFIGMAAGICIMGGLPDTPLLLAAAFIVGLFSGPASALLGFFVYDRIAEGRRGSAMGTLNALYLVVAPAGTFIGSTLIATLGIPTTCLAMAVFWVAVTVAALAAPALRDLDDDARADGVQPNQADSIEREVSGA